MTQAIRPSWTAAGATALALTMFGRPPETFAQTVTPRPPVLPCTPARSVGFGLPTPPVIDTAATASFRLNVESDGAHRWCYVRDGDTRPYLEAPTIVARAGSTFTVTLVDRARSPGSSAPAPPPARSGDGCALLGVSAALPSASALGYVNRPRVPNTMAAGEMRPNDTNLHTHGLHVDPDIDNVFKSLARSDDGTCTYRFTVRADQPPGTYWYHAHLHGLAETQVGGGLAGTLIVLPAAVAAELPETVVLVKNFSGPEPALQAIRTLRLQHVPRIPSPSPPPPRLAFDPFKPPPFASGVAFSAAVPPCRTTAIDTLGVNGLHIPTAASDAQILGLTDVPLVEQKALGPGARYRVVNASADSYLNLRMIAGTQAQMSYQTLNVLGRDGVPVNWNASTRRLDPAKPEMVQRPNVFLPPGGRVDLFVPANTRATLIGSAAASPFCTGPLSFTGLPSRGILRIVPGARLPSGPGVPTPRLPRADRSVWTHAALIARRPEPTVAQRALTFTEYDDGSFYVTQTGTRPKPLASYVEHPFALRAAVAPPAPSPLPSGSRYQADIWVHKLAPPNRTVEVWNLYNATAETHAFHIHQLTFVALQSAYEPTDAQQVFLDTIAVPPATVFRPRAGVANQLLAPSLTQIKIDFTDVAVGTFVFHCHMLFHEDAGMMGIIHVY